MSTRRLVLPLKSVLWRALYTSNLAASLEFAGMSHGLDAEAADSLTPDSGRLLLRCGGFDRWRSRREGPGPRDATRLAQLLCDAGKRERTERCGNCHADWRQNRPGNHRAHLRRRAARSSSEAGKADSPHCDTRRML